MFFDMKTSIKFEHWNHETQCNTGNFLLILTHVTHFAYIKPVFIIELKLSSQVELTDKMICKNCKRKDWTLCLTKNIKQKLMNTKIRT
jgi:hypothetical protein